MFDSVSLVHAFLFPMMIVAFGTVGYHFIKEAKKNKKRPMATFNRR